MEEIEKDFIQKLYYGDPKIEDCSSLKYAISSWYKDAPLFEKSLVKEILSFISYHVEQGKKQERQRIIKIATDLQLEKGYKSSMKVAEIGYRSAIDELIEKINPHCECGHLEEDHFNESHDLLGGTHQCNGDEGMCECCEFTPETIKP